MTPQSFGESNFLGEAVGTLPQPCADPVVGNVAPRSFERDMTFRAKQLEHSIISVQTLLAKTLLHNFLEEMTFWKRLVILLLRTLRYERTRAFRTSGESEYRVNPDAAGTRIVSDTEPCEKMRSKDIHPASVRTPDLGEVLVARLASNPEGHVSEKERDKERRRREEGEKERRREEGERERGKEGKKERRKEERRKKGRERRKMKDGNGNGISRRSRVMMRQAQHKKKLPGNFAT